MQGAAAARGQGGPLCQEGGAGLSCAICRLAATRLTCRKVQVYNDNWFSLAMIRYFASKVGAALRLHRPPSPCRAHAAGMQMSANLDGAPYERSWDGFVHLSQVRTGSPQASSACCGPPVFAHAQCLAGPTELMAALALWSDAACLRSS